MPWVSDGLASLARVTTCLLATLAERYVVLPSRLQPEFLVVTDRLRSGLLNQLTDRISYFTHTSVIQDENAQRWLYYRKRTEGQNTVVLNYLNQNVDTQPSTVFGSSGDAQGASTVKTLADGSTAFYTMDLTSAYNGTSILRGVRTLNQRKQVLYVQISCF